MATSVHPWSAATEGDPPVRVTEAEEGMALSPFDVQAEAKRAIVQNASHR